MAVTRNDKVYDVGFLDDQKVRSVISITQMGHDTLYFAYVSIEGKPKIGKMRLSSQYMGQDNFRTDAHTIVYDAVTMEEGLQGNDAMIELGSLKANNTYLFIMTFELMVN